MTFPANYSVIAENELTYVTGGALLDGSSMKTFTTNLVKIIGNTFEEDFVNRLLGTMFGGSYAFGQASTNFGNMFSGMNGFNVVMQILGLGAAVYSLGTNDAVTLQDDGAVTYNA